MGATKAEFGGTSETTNRYINGGHFSIQIQVSDLEEKKKKTNGLFGSLERKESRVE